MACKHCWINAKPISKIKDEVTFEKLRSSIYEAKELGLKRLKITGGEPYVRSHLLHELIKLSSELKISVYIETNGTFINDSEAQFLKQHNVVVSISLDFPDERFDEFRGLKGSFKYVKRAMELLSKHGVPWACIMTATKSNMNDVPNLAELVLKLGPYSLKVHPCNASGRAKGFEIELLTLTDYICLIQTIVKLYEMYPGKISTSVPWALIAPFEKWPFRISGVCRYKKLLSILPNGDIALCGVGITHPETVFGNIYRDSITDIWINNGGYLKEIRSLTPDSFKGICSRCVFRKPCANMCPAYAYETFGTFSASYPICEELYQAALFPKEYLLDQGSMPAEAEGKFLQLWETSRYLGIPVNLTYEMLEQGDLPGEKIEGWWRIDLEKLQHWLDEEVPQEEVEKLAKRLKVDRGKVQ